jgi:membrane protease subunit (stomatin/prohibitin family)
MERIVEQTLLYDFYGELLNEHQRQIYTEAVFNDYSLSEIADEYGISRQGVHDLIKRVVRERVVAVLDQLLMKWISKEGKDMFNLQANAYDISAGIKEDLDMQMIKIGLTITDFNISSFSYPEEVQKMQNKAASQSMVGDMNKYAQMAMADNMSNGKSSNIGVDMMNMQMGLQMGRQMMDSMNSMSSAPQSTGAAQSSTSGSAPKFCPECGSPTNGAKFCSNCGHKLV